jgi:hypothetical protein
MLYILRLTNGDCVLALAADECSARQMAGKLSGEEGAEVTTVRTLDNFAVQLSPTEEGTLEVAHWDDAALDGILASEYPLLFEAYRRANAQPLLTAPSSEEKTMAHLEAAYEQNTEIIRQGLRSERQRYSHGVPQETSPKAKSARARM